MRRISLLLWIVPLLFAAGCAGSKALQNASTGDVPEWYTNIPQDPNYLFAVASATSQDMQLAIDKAVVNARTEIARQTEVKVSGIQKRFDEEVGMGENSQLMQQFTQASKTVVSTSLTGSRVRSQKTSKDGTIWRGYVLMEYPIGAASQALLNQLNGNSLMYTQFKATQAYKELDEEVQKYEEWKKGQAAPMK